MRKIIAAIAFLSMTGCGGSVFGQVPPSKAPNIVWTWNAPSACNAIAPCSYYISVLVVPNGTASCPPSTGISYTPINGGVATPALTITDTGETLGTTVCAIAQTLQNGLISQWSAPSNAVVVPASAPVPGAPNGTEKVALLMIPDVSVTDGHKELAMSGQLVWK